VWGEAPVQLRLRSGEAREIPRVSAAPSVRITPPLAHPFRLEPAAGGLRVTVPPATPAGRYTVELSGGPQAATSIEITVDPVQVPRAAGGRPPVILLNGFQILCTNRASTIAASADTFGLLGPQLAGDGASVFFFNNCSYGNDVPLEELANQLANFLGALTFTDGSPVQQVDMVAHSMGGLIVRAYLAGLQPNGVLLPPADPKVRKVVFAATPHFGSFQASKISTNETDAMLPASAFLLSLAEWNQGQDDLRGVDALSVTGNAGSHFNRSGGMDDGVVPVTSASLGFARTQERTRVVPYCHVTPTPLALLGMDCTAARGIVDIDSDAHLTSRIVRSYLSGTSEWMTIGTTPGQDPVLSQSGGVVFTAKTAADALVKDLTGVFFGSAALSPGAIPQASFFLDFLKGTDTFTASTTSGSRIACGPYTQPAGFFRDFPCKQGPAMTSVGPLVSAGDARVVLSGADITISGSGFGQPCGTCSVLLSPGGQMLAPVSWTDQSIVVKMPAFAGLAQLAVKSASGSASIRAFTAAPVLPVQVTSIANAASGVAGAIAPGEIVTLKGTGLGPAAGVSLVLNSSGGVDTALAGVRVSFNGIYAPVLYASDTQINAIVPYELAGAAVAVVQVTYANHASALTPIAVAEAAPGIFTVNRSGKGPAAAIRSGPYVALFFTGGGQTDPPGVTGSVNGTVLKRIPVNVTASVGGVPASVTFAGAAPLLVDGAMQLNLQLSPGTPPGAQPVVITVGGISSPATATIEVP
jgi:uncharacterized protein (TIGR03437 family)